MEVENAQEGVFMLHSISWFVPIRKNKCDENDILFEVEIVSWPTLVETMFLFSLKFREQETGS